MDFKIAVLAGDGIGPEISTVGVDDNGKLSLYARKFGHKGNRCIPYAISAPVLSTKAVAS